MTTRRRLLSLLHLSWFTPGWWSYLFERPVTLRALWCRATGHRSVVYYNPGGWEPDYHCTGCGDDLG